MNLQTNRNAAHLLVGIPEEDTSIIERQVGNVIVVGQTISCSLLKLMRMMDPEVAVYDSGRTRFVRMLWSSDLLSATPLEAAYGWTLSCMSALNGFLRFNSYRYNIRCNALQSSRLFPTKYTSTYKFDHLEKGVLYYCDEHSGKPQHPLFDIFFRTTDNKVVLVDITGSNNKDQLVERKKKNRVKWIEKAQKVTDCELHGIILAPLCTGESTRCGKGIFQRNP